MGPMLHGHAEPLGAVARGKNLIPCLEQIITHELQNIGFVVDQKNAVLHADAL